MTPVRAAGIILPMRFTVEPSPAGGYWVRMEGADAPVSHHDTEEEAEAAAWAYRHGAERQIEWPEPGGGEEPPGT